ncbi:MAG: hypothetical protein CL893_02705 [Dehalococcoidia bacterium]|nr:hypothetical protein [Dehalococcoidia bacterium]|tara:strand:+ start:10186 stop:10935 length:750 start_codon:yes stop_codon:yes gene_type:complete
MKNKISNKIFYLLFAFFISTGSILYAESEVNIEDIVVNEYNMSILSVDQNDQSLSVITAVKITNENQNTFIPNFSDVAKTGMNFIRFSLPEGFYDLYVETDLPSGNLIEMPQGFALTSEIPSGSYNLIFSYYVKYKSSEFSFPLHFPHGSESFKIIIPEKSGVIKGEKISFDKNIEISSKQFDEYLGKEYSKGEYLNLEMVDIPSSFVNKVSSSLNFQLINFIVIIIMINIIVLFFALRFLKNKKNKNA